MTFALMFIRVKSSPTNVRSKGISFKNDNSRTLTKTMGQKNYCQQRIDFDELEVLAFLAKRLKGLLLKETCGRTKEIAISLSCFGYTLGNVLLVELFLLPELP